MVLDILQNLSPSEWFCCDWSLRAFQNGSSALDADSTHSVTQAEFVAFFDSEAHRSKNSCTTEDSRKLLIRCYAALEEAVAPGPQRYKPGPALAMAGLALLSAGIAANALICCSIVLIGAMRTKKNAFLLNLAVADILVLLVCAPYSTQLILLYDWRWDRVMCKLRPFIQGSLMSVSIWSQASVAVYRYLVVCHPMRARSLVTARRVAGWIVVVWAFSVMLCSPNLVSHSYTSHQIVGIFLLRFCTEDANSQIKRGFTVALLVCLYLIPAVVMAAFCGLSIRTLNRSLRFLSRSSQLAERQTRRLQTSRLLLVLLAAFVLCWGPYNCLTLWLHTVQDRGSEDRLAVERLYLVQFACLALGFSNSAVNPLCLLCISTEIRRHCWRLLRLRCWQSEATAASATVNHQGTSLISVSRRSQENQHNQEQRRQLSRQKQIFIIDPEPDAIAEEQRAE